MDYSDKNVGVTAVVAGLVEVFINRMASRLNSAVNR